MRKTIEEFGPLLVFFVLNARGADWFSLPETQSLFIATGGFMAALVVAIASTYARGEKPNNLTLASAGFVLVFGSITLFLQAEMFIKIKPTLVYLLFAPILTFGLMRRRPYLQMLMGHMLPLSSEIWLVLTRRWTIFFVFLALLNEAVWRTQSTDVWVSFKVFAILPLTIGFMVLQMPLLRKHLPEDFSENHNNDG